MAKVLLDTPCGKIEGFCEDGINKFLGIRYATAGRFEYAKEITSWDGVYDASKYGANPIQRAAFEEYQQTGSFYEREFRDGLDLKYDEDCLFLNIYAPENAENCPVLVVIYGGGNMKGESNTREFMPEALVKKGIIVCTFNYRLNVFGLMAMKELEDENGKCGSYLYHDQHTAFMFIRHNIEAFGGDGNNMTLIGQSAGAADCETQIKSSLNKGVFKNAIIMSGSGFVSTLKAKDNTKEVYDSWNEIYKDIGCTSVEELKTMPAEKLFASFIKIAGPKQLQYSEARYDQDFSGPEKNKPVDTNVMCSMTKNDTMPLLFYVMMNSLVKSQIEKAAVYTYYFTRDLPGDECGAWHSSDLWYVYGNLKDSWRPFTEKDYELSDKMMTYIANFVKTGNPNCKELPEWHQRTKHNKESMVFDIDKCEMSKIKLFEVIKNQFNSKVGPGL